MNHLYTGLLFFACFITFRNAINPPISSKLKVFSKNNSCKGRCGDKPDPHFTCQCNRVCSKYKDCCNNYNQFCRGPSRDTFMKLFKKLYRKDKDNVGKYVSFDTRLDGPLFASVDERVLKIRTISEFLKLFDNFEKFTNYTEIDTPIEISEKNAFLYEVMATEVMKITESFLIKYGYIKKALKQVLDEIFFAHYPREKNVLGSSGFEHVFIGEIDDGKVKGLHNWLSFYVKEKKKEIVYDRYYDHVQMSRNLSQVKVGFTWGRYVKQQSTILIGSSPEYELALYTVCFFAFPNQQCEVISGDRLYYIQTYKDFYDGLNRVGTAYTIL